MKRSVFDNLTVVDVLRSAGLPVPSNRDRCIRCPLPGHDDRTPSFKIVGPNATGWICFAGCGKGWPVDLIIRLGYAHDPREAAVWLEERMA